LKTVILIALAALSGAVGIYFRAGLLRRLVILREIRYMLDEFIMLIRFKGATVREIIDTVASDSRLADLTFLAAVSAKFQDGEVSQINDDGKNFAEVWQSAAADFRQNGLTATDIKLIENIGKNLGTTDTAGQLASLSLYQNEAETAFIAAEAETAKKAKLYTSLGVLAGAFLVVFLI
jgi:stage III sporulation protein AB